jgi:hypothetical protein
MLNKLLHSLLDGKIMNSVMSWTDIQTEVMITPRFVIKIL